MEKHFFDYNDGDFSHAISDNMVIDSEGEISEPNLIQNRNCTQKTDFQSSLGAVLFCVHISYRTVHRIHASTLNNFAVPE